MNCKGSNTRNRNSKGNFSSELYSKADYSTFFDSTVEAATEDETLSTAPARVDSLDSKASAPLSSKAAPKAILNY